jgi:hypothetical protein
MYRFVLGGVEVTCDTAAELRAALAVGGGTQSIAANAVTAGAFPPTKSPQRKSVPNRSVGVKKSWAMAQWLAERENCSREEARSKLADLKKADFSAYKRIEGEFYTATEVHNTPSDKKAKK